MQNSNYAQTKILLNFDYFNKIYLIFYANNNEADY